MNSVLRTGIIILIGTTIFLLFSGCADDYDPTQNQAAPFIESKYEDITFLGSIRSDVVFQHKVHSERLANNCFQCHFCGDLTGETHWMCRDCHSPLDTERLCDNDSDHGCTYTQCEYCHTLQATNPTPSCRACHP